VRIISSALLAAQKSASAVPYLRVTISDLVGGIRRLVWTRLYTGSEPDGYHAACTPGDGSLIRARVTGGHVYYQRVASPGPSSNFSSWTDLGAAANAGVALCANGSRVLLFYVDSGGTLIRVRESTDNGVTLGSAVTAATASGAATWLAGAVKSSGDALVTYSVGAAVSVAKRTGGSWGSPTSWPGSAASITGLACWYRLDWNFIIAGTDSAGQAFVWSTLLGDGYSKPAGTWATQNEVTRASAGSSVTFRAPFVISGDVYRLSFVEKFTGTVAYARPCHSYSPASADFAFNLWREPLPFNLASDYGQAIAASAISGFWLSTPNGVWQASLATTTLDVSADVIECTTRDAPFDGSFRLVLRNDDGRYSAGAAPLKIGAEVRIGTGYQTSSGPAASDGPWYWIDGIEYRTGDGTGSVVITGRNGWGLLESWRARRTYAWAAGATNVFNILLSLFARAGLEFASISPSSDSGSLKPAFTIQPGEPALRAVQRLLAMLPDVIYLETQYGYLNQPLATDAAAVAYGVDYPILGGRYGGHGAQSNRVQVFGSTTFSESFDWPSIDASYDRLAQVSDKNLTTQAQTDSRAAAVLRHALTAARADEITVPVNCAIALWDAISVTDTGAGLAAAKRRVAGIALRYATGARPVYEQRLTLQDA
jgi:hypothetical protein